MANNIKHVMLASDFDGTLCQSYTPATYPATEEVLSAIRAFRADGGIFGIATGRDWYWGWRELDENGKLDFDFIITLNGAQIYDRAGDLLYEAAADGRADVGGKPLARALAERCWELVGDVLFFNVGKDRYYFSPNLPDGGEYDGDSYSPHAMLDEIGAFHMAGAIGQDAGKIPPAAEILTKEFGAHLNFLLGSRSIDIPPCGIDKGAAVAACAERLGIPKENIWTAGDSGNDLAMLCQPFHGCAMAGGTQAAKDAAEFVCRDITEVIARIRESQQN